MWSLLLRTSWFCQMGQLVPYGLHPAEAKTRDLTGQG